MPPRRDYQETLEKLLETGSTRAPAIMHISNRIKTERGILKLLRSDKPAAASQEQTKTLKEAEETADASSTDSP